MNLQDRIEKNIEDQKFYDELIEVSKRLIELSIASAKEYDTEKALKHIELLKAKSSELNSKKTILLNELNSQ